MPTSTKTKGAELLADARPELKELWDEERNETVFHLKFEDVLTTSRDRLYWKCPVCNYSMRVAATIATRYGVRCERCKQREAEERRKANDAKKRAARERRAARGNNTTPAPAKAERLTSKTTPVQNVQQNRTIDLAVSPKAVIGRHKKTGAIIMFETARLAADAVGLKHPSDITKCCKNPQLRHTAGGYEWRYLSEKPDDWEMTGEVLIGSATDAQVRPVTLDSLMPSAASTDTPPVSPDVPDSLESDASSSDSQPVPAVEVVTQCCYATSFVAESATGEGTVWPLVVEAVYDWFDYKDRQIARDVKKTRLKDVVDYELACAWHPDIAISPATAVKLRAALSHALAHYASEATIDEGSDAVDMIVSVPPYIDLQSSVDNVPSPAVVPASFANGGNAERGRLRVATNAERDDDGILIAWTATLNEVRPEKDETWNTCVTVTPNDDGTAFVEVRNELVVPANSPSAKRSRYSQPKCVSNVINRADLVCRRAGNVLSGKPQEIDLTNTQQFEAFLLEVADTSRRVPLIVVNSNESGKYPLSDVSIARLADRVSGIAHVCMVPWLDSGVGNRFVKGLSELTDVRSLAPQRGEINVYLGYHADIRSDNAYKLLVEQDKSEGKTIQRIVNVVVAATKERSNVEQEPKVADPADVLASTDGEVLLEDRIEDQHAADAPAPLAAEHVVSTPATSTLDALQLAASIAHDSFKSLNDLIMSLEATDLANVADTATQITTLEADNASLRRANLELEEQTAGAIRNERDAVSKAQHYEKLYHETKSERDRLNTKLNVLDQLDNIPTNMPEVVALAGRMFADRLVITPKAVRSAEDDNTGSYTEAWRILRALERDLWPMCFDENDKPTDRIAMDFRNRTGFELSLNESPNTRCSQRCRTQRELRYNNKTLSLEPHVKGQSGTRTNRLRVHFAIDREERKIIIGHCGNHLDTAGTKRKEL